ncbi:MAG TPA: VCBS repeat-containing protein, partial [Planctomycetaceae bacterium]|nr:VCBS repeat-containing protein [Planctomycetaceae bacterium]
MTWSWFHRLLSRRGRPFTASRFRTPRRPSSLPAMIELLEPRQLPAAPAVSPTLSAADDGVVTLAVSTGEWQATRFDGSQFVAESLTTWSSIPEDIVTVQGDLWATGQKQLVHFEPATGLFQAEWISGSANSQGTVAGWMSGMDLQFLTARDLDHNGFDDLIAMDRHTGNWALSTFHAGNQSDSRFVGTWRADVNWQHVQFADLNADGWDDVVGYNPGDRTWNALLGGSSSFTPVTFTDSTPAANIVDVRLADFDSRAGTDILYRNTTSGNWTAISLVSGQFQARTVGTWSTSGTWTDVLAVDFWGLGREAIVGRNVQSNQWQMTWSVGSGMTTAPISIWGTGSYADAFIADLNRDG